MRTKTRIFLVLLFALSVMLGGCAAPGGRGDKAAIVNGVPISLADFEKQVTMVQQSMIEQGLDPKTPEGRETLDLMRVDILNQLVDTELMRQAAKKEGITVTDADVNARMQQIKKDVGGDDAFKKSLQEAKISEADFRTLIVRDQMLYERLYDKLTSSLPTTAEQVHVRHILVSSEKDAKDVRSRLAKGEDFAALAKEVSQDLASKDNGGDLGFFPRGLLDPAFEEAMFKLKVNEIGIVSTEFGYHVLQVLAHEASRALAVEIQQVLGEQAVNRYIEDLRAKAKVEYIVQLPPTPTPSQ